MKHPKGQSSVPYACSPLSLSIPSPRTLFHLYACSPVHCCSLLFTHQHLFFPPPSVAMKFMVCCIWDPKHHLLKMIPVELCDFCVTSGDLGATGNRGKTTWGGITFFLYLLQPPSTMPAPLAVRRWLTRLQPIGADTKLGGQGSCIKWRTS